jgi:hypothetical protein
MGEARQATGRVRARQGKERAKVRHAAKAAVQGSLVRGVQGGQALAA